MGSRPSPQVVSILERLVAFDTVSSKSNLDLIDWIRRYLSDLGLATSVLPSERGDKASLLARIGPDEEPAIALSAHTDVVPVAGQTWSTDPFTLIERDGKLYGRGSCDMKGFVALMLAAVPAMMERPLKRPLQLILTYDEETTMDGVADSLRHIDREWQRPAAVIVGEPTSMQVVDAHLSIGGVRMVLHGRAAHSSLPHLGASAIEAAHEIVGELMRIRDEFIAAGDPTGRFTPPHSTLNVGRIEGGQAHNIVAPSCMLEFSMRGVPGSDIEGAIERVIAFAEGPVLNRMRKAAPEAHVEIERWLLAPALSPRPGSEAELLAMRLAGRNRTTTVSYATEAGHYQRADIPTVVCGPGSIDQAHAPDEFIELGQLAAGEAFIQRLIEDCRA